MLSFIGRFDQPKRIFFYLSKCCSRTDQKSNVGGAGEGRGRKEDEEGVGGCHRSKVLGMWHARVCEARRQPHIPRTRTVVQCAGKQHIPTCCMDVRRRSQTERSWQLIWDTSELLLGSFQGQHVKAYSPALCDVTRDIGTVLPSVTTAIHLSH